MEDAESYESCYLEYLIKYVLINVALSLNKKKLPSAP